LTQIRGAMQIAAGPVRTSFDDIRQRRIWMMLQSRVQQMKQGRLAGIGRSNDSHTWSQIRHSARIIAEAFPWNSRFARGNANEEHYLNVCVSPYNSNGHGARFWRIMPRMRFQPTFAPSTGGAAPKSPSFPRTCAPNRLFPNHHF